MIDRSIDLKIAYNLEKICEWRKSMMGELYPLLANSSSTLMKRRF